MCGNDGVGQLVPICHPRESGDPVVRGRREGGLDSFRRGNDRGAWFRRESTAVKEPVVYILASQRNGTLYTGVTSDLVARVWQHRNDLVEGFTKKYSVHLLVYFELHGEMEIAIAREKQLKKWRREWKLKLIEDHNPNWEDLYPRIV